MISLYIIIWYRFILVKSRAVIGCWRGKINFLLTESAVIMGNYHLMYRGLYTGYKPPNLYLNLARTMQHLLCPTGDLNWC